MFKNIFRVLSIPFVYVFFILYALFKWLILAPIIFCLYLLKHSIIWIIIGIVAGFFLTPIATIIILLISILFSLSNIFSEMSMGLFGTLNINWNYGRDIFIQNENNNLIRKRNKLIKIANKNYYKSKDEFIGFNSISDIYKK